ncbi:MAG: type II toxin-antitoxin system RelE/ParE family toxin [Bacteroidetes bacterium]|nr:type II toxin-antitoxin system RelE/ParE family toxin [Bacteroidota bacterium]MBS1634150.1 type II toxin-antitoxin system RelE/ParE family toxin [Bacteroidota bacterium]
MEKEIVWTPVAQKDFWEIITYLEESWPEKVLKQFHKSLQQKAKLLQKQPQLGFKSSKFSRFRKTLVTKHYLLIYSVSKEHIVIHRLKHTSLK